MSFLNVANTTVPVARNTTTGSTIEVGSRERAFEGNVLSSVRALKSEYSIETVPMTRTDADALLTVLRTGAAVSCWGDLLGLTVGSPASFHTTGITEEYRVYADGQRVVIRFVLMEA